MLVLLWRRQGPHVGTVLCECVFVCLDGLVQGWWNSTDTWSAGGRVPCQNLHTGKCSARAGLCCFWTMRCRCRLTACSAFPAPKMVNQIRRRDRRGIFRRIGYNEHDSPGRAFTGRAAASTSGVWWLNNDEDAGPNAGCARLRGIGHGRRRTKNLRSSVLVPQRLIFSSSSVVGAPPAEGCVESPATRRGGDRRGPGTA